MRTTYERWAAAVGDNFAFAVKAPNEITHGLRLVHTKTALEAFLAEIAGLGGKLGPLLFQLPPSLAFDAQIARSFFATLRTHFDGSVVCEPRHPGWFTTNAEDLLAEFRISRVAPDPPMPGGSTEPGGWSGLAYFRLHGAPHVYYSEYSPAQLERYAARLMQSAADGRPVWCIFDNTAAGAATANALALLAVLEDGSKRSCSGGAIDR